MDISDSELGQIFPFFFHLDLAGELTMLGPSLRRYIEANNQPLELFTQFVFQSPEATCLDDINQHIDKVFLLSLADQQSLMLRGQFLRLQQKTGLLFLGVPWVTDLKSLDELGLTLKDYSLYEPTTYFLMLTEAQRSSLEKSACVQQQLTELNDSLTRRVERRTERLSEINEELIASQTKLREEMRQREEMEIELRLAQEREALGLLSAGIAHEINTPIQFIGDSLSFIQDAADDLRQAARQVTDLLDLKNPEIKQKLLSINENYDLEYLIDRVPESIERAISGVNRVSSIVKSMKAFSHHDVSVKNFANINEAIENTLIVTRNEYKMVAKMETHLGDIPELYCSVGDLNQVFLNLIVNAAQAITQRFNDDKNTTLGKITITTRKIANQLVIVIADNGCGIPSTIIERIFDPFFTTKSIGKGSGQGLALCHRVVVNQHGGKIKVDSTPGQGAEFRIYLPITNPEDE